MKTLILMRHAKSDWGSENLSDFDRPLNGRGRRAASDIGKYLLDQNLIPDLILVSAAERTQETVHRMTTEWSKCGHAPPEIIASNDLYLAKPATLMSELRGIDHSAASVMIIAHNPGIAELARQISIDGDAELLARICKKFPTGALTICRLRNGDWSNANAKALESLSFVQPKDLKGK